MSDKKDERATGLIAKQGIELLTFGTPNGHKASILLEELKEAYGKDYTAQPVPIMDNVQKEAWFVKLNPNGRIPVIVDHDNKDFPVFEGSAILAYLTRKYDPEHKFSFEYDSDDFSTAEQWIAWQHGGLGPMAGQSNHFYRLAKERIPYPTQRYVGESERLYGILEKRLSDRDYIAGPGKGKYSIADIASFSWVNYALFGGIDIHKFPKVKAWSERIAARPAVQKGIAVPHESSIVNASFEQKLKEDEEFKQKEESLRKHCEESKKQYDYKYQSP